MLVFYWFPSTFLLLNSHSKDLQTGLLLDVVYKRSLNDNNKYRIKSNCDIDVKQQQHQTNKQTKCNHTNNNNNNKKKTKNYKDYHHNNDVVMIMTFPMATMI